MNAADSESGDKTIVLDAEALNKAVQHLAREIAAANDTPEQVALLGILRRGRPLADRIAAAIEAAAGVRPRVGSLATTLYRDDVRSGRRGVTAAAGGTHFDFNVDGANVILVDDVVSTGRTTRAALDEIMDYGRPARIQLACLVDRGHRELPIQPDYCGWRLATAPEDHVSVCLTETDGFDAVLLEHHGALSAEEGGGEC